MLNPATGEAGVRQINACAFGTQHRTRHRHGGAENRSRARHRSHDGVVNWGENFYSKNKLVHVHSFGEPAQVGDPGTNGWVVIKMQSDSYLGENDIIRFEDNYGRA